MLIITADHSFPSGRGGSLFQEVGATEDNFRIPISIIAPPRVEKLLQNQG